LPNGKGVLFTVWSGALESTQLAVHEFATGRHRILSSGTQPRYVPTGHVLFTEGFALYAAPFDIDRLELTGDAVPIADNVEVNPTGAGQFAVTPHGNGILGYVVSSGTGGRDSLVWVDRTGEVGETAIADPERGLAAFRLSPDGNRVLVQTAQPRGELWVYI
ncbi:MAG TPA: hypothetical protein VEK15_22310, partial [Vicinamibacteria bacterium]|nr:hypothetical protein [Vicinamibacteria bacterium]